jgi:hypothetical protein
MDTDTMMQLNVNMLSGEELAVVRVNPSWTVAKLKSSLDPYIKQSGAHCRDLLTYNNHASLDDRKSIYKLVQPGDTLIAVIGIDEELQTKISQHVGKLQDGTVSARYHAAENLAVLGSAAKQAAPALEKVLREDSSAIVRKSAALALGEIQCSHSEQILMHTMRHDEDKFVRERAEQALKSLERHAALSRGLAPLQ